jgi:oligosaccharide repeat unit polymerase
MMLGLAVLAWRNGGPLLAMAIAWLVCLTPVATGMISYGYLAFSSDRYVWIVALSVAAFLGGTFLAAMFHPAPPVARTPNYDWDSDLARWLPVAKFCLAVSAVAIASAIANIVTLGYSLTDLGVIREGVINADAAGLLPRITSITIWACFFCIAFALYFRHKLKIWQFLLFASTGVGIFLSTLAVAGRGSVFQVVLLTLVLEAIRARRLDKGSGGRRFLTKMAVLGASGFYIVYITMNRSTGGGGGLEKADQLLYLFNASLNPMIESALEYFGGEVREFVVESLIYVSHTVPLFSVFVEIDFGPLGWGLHDFPFVFRQFEPFFHYNVIEAYRLRTFYLQAEGVIGVGWNTALASLLLDFGTPGMLIFMAAQGFVSQWSWSGVRRQRGFGMVLVCVVMMIAAVYLPYMGAFSDTNMFLLMSFLALTAFIRSRSRAPSRPVLAAQQP